MRILPCATLALGFFLTVSANLVPRSYDTHDYFALHLDDSADPSHVARLLGARHEGQIGELPGHHTFSLPRDSGSNLDSLLDELRARQKLRRRSAAPVASLGRRDGGLDGILWSQKLAPKKRLHKRIPPPVNLSKGNKEPQPDTQAVQDQQRIADQLGISDPIFDSQWHLFNTIQIGHDLNVTDVWLEGITGKGVVTAIVDDGLDMYSKDLKPNYYAQGSYDFNEQSDEPRPRLYDDNHGTRCAGEVAAVKNDVCGVGVAYDSKVSGIRILSKPIDDADEAAAVNFAFQHNDIYSCSWGPPDDGETMEAPGILIKRAMVNGVQNGRGGKGSIFVFAAGNGAGADDDCNFDGYTNSIYSITVGAIDREGEHAPYSESCSAQLVVAYSSGAGDAIHTTDVGADKCYSHHGGTSAAGPLAAGAVALALSVQPELTWRDVQYLMVEAAVPVHEDDGSWQETGNGMKFSHDWGFGKVDAYALVQKAKSWNLVKPQAWYTSPWLRVQHDIPQGDQGLASSYEVTEEMIKKANLERLEHVTLTMNVNHTRRGDLSVDLHSPSGVVSRLSKARRSDNAPEGYIDWTFMSVAHWGETGVGKWTVIVKDSKVNENNGTFVDWQLNLWGEAIDGDKQSLYPLPDEHDHDHDIEDAVVATTSLPAAPTPTRTPATPTDAVDRPVKQKPSPAVTTSPVDAAADTAASPSPTSSRTFLPSFFPTFGASKRTQIWIYASVGLIILFCVGLGVYFQVQRRKRIRSSPRDDYEFEMIENEDEPDAANGHSSGRTRRRGGELYNAFAGESDEELFSDEDEKPLYKDRAESDSAVDGEHDQSGKS